MPHTVVLRILSTNWPHFRALVHLFVIIVWPFVKVLIPRNFRPLSPLVNLPSSSTKFLGFDFPKNDCLTYLRYSFPGLPASLLLSVCSPPVAPLINSGRRYGAITLRQFAASGSGFLYLDTG